MNPPVSPNSPAKQGYELQVEPARNLLRINYRGRVTASVAKAMADQAKDLVAQLRPGFTVLTDLTELESMAIDCVPQVTRLMEICKARGIGTTMRVIPDPKKDIGLTILANIHYGRAVHIVTHKTLAEAEKAL